MRIAAAVLIVCTLRGQPAAVSDAAAALQRGDFTGAERILRTELQARPDDAWTLSLLGYSLDNQKRGQEAEAFHRRAVALSPHSAEILNNFGTHLWIAGDYGQAETVFAEALAAAPTYFNALYNLGVMATNAGHYGRAREVLQTALRQQPDNVDVLYRLAAAEELSKHWEDALGRLAHAAQIDPKRADVQKLLAFTATEMGALSDAAAAWDRYLALQPDDDAARRERGYTAVKIGRLEQGIAEIEWYLARHPDDTVGHYELAQAERSLDEAKAFQHLDRALALDPAYIAALAARGSLYYQDGKFEPALHDLEAAAALDPRDAATLDRLGQTYQALDRAADAVRVLRKAAELAPADSKILLHFGRALADAGQTMESKAVMDRFRQLGPEKKNVIPEGLVSYLALTPEQRRADYRARLESSIREHPDDTAAQLAYLKFLLEARDAASATAAAHRIAAMKPGADVLAEAGQALLDANRFDLAKELLQQAAGANPPIRSAQLGLALATFQGGNPASAAKTALALLDRIPVAQRDGESELARARMLEAAGRSQEAAAALHTAVRMSPDRPEVRLRAAATLIAKDRAAEAPAILGESDDREILLMKATTLELLHRGEECASLLADLRRRWPEWSAAWAAAGIIAAGHQQYREAAQSLEGAVALGSGEPETFYFLAKTYDALGRKEEAQSARARIQPADPTASDASYRKRFFAGSLLVKAVIP